jgi:hypothetical protein
MPRARIVSLPSDQAPIFPDACVACGRAAPGRTAKIPLVNDARDDAGFKEQTIDTPFCRPCERTLDWYYVRRVAVAVVLLGALFTGLGPWQLAVFFSPTLEALHRLSPWLPAVVVPGGYLLLTLIVLGIVWLWSNWSPPSFDPRWRPGVVDYRFRNAAQAAAFARINPAHESGPKQLPQQTGHANTAQQGSALPPA